MTEGSLNVIMFTVFTRKSAAVLIKFSPLECGAYLMAAFI